jgi:hypothetical protein
VGVTFTVTVAVPTLPAASRARASIEWLPAASEETATVHAVVPVAAVGAPPSTVMLTPTTPTLSPAFPVTATAPVVSVAPFCGLVIATVGGVASLVVLATTTETLAVAVLPARSVARLVMVWLAFERLVVSSAYVHDVVPPAG